MDPLASPKGASRAQLRRYKWLLAIFWTGVIALLLTWSVDNQRNATLEIARVQASSTIEKDIIYRSWSAGHGGVYAPVTEHTPPNPYLQHLPERDITTPSGRKLTLINPAYMTRQVHELEQQRSGAKGHLTSLKLLRPENRPDRWETEALQAMARGASEVSSIETHDGEQRMRLMRPLFVEQGCLKCHAVQGYQLGDLCGGISTSIPMAPLNAASTAQTTATFVGHVAIWALGMTGILVGMWHAGRHIRQRDQAEDRLRKLSVAVEQSPVSIMITDTQGTIEYVNPMFTMVTGYTAEEAIGRNPRILKSGKWPKEAYQALWDKILAGELWTGEFENKKKSGEVYWEAASICPIRDAQGPITHFLAVKQDITERKRAERQLQEAKGAAEESAHSAERALADMERMNAVMTGREERVLEMKQEVNDLLAKLGRASRYEHV